MFYKQLILQLKKDIVNMRSILVLIVFFVSLGNVNATPLNELVEILNSAKLSDKNLLIKVLDKDTPDPFSTISFPDKFIETTLYASNAPDAEILKNYRVDTYPSIILLNSKGNLILPVKIVNTPEEIEDYVEKALKIKEDKPIAQMDLDYGSNKMGEKDLYEYIVKRSALNLNNANIIDKYSTLATKSEIINKNVLSLFLENNTINVPGLFFSFVENNLEEIKHTLKLSDERFYCLIDNSIEYCFQNVCKNKDEAGLTKIVDAKISAFSAESKNLIHHEYLTRYFYSTSQPLKLATQASVYVDALLEHKEQHKNKTQNRKLYSSTSLIDPVTQIAYAIKLRNAAQYVVETLSSKAMLNNALSWSKTAAELSSNNCDIYETQAYILYKLGQKENAIERMEKAYSLISKDNVAKIESIGFNLIKMKRGEKIF